VTLAVKHPVASLAAVRALFLERQHLARPRAAGLTERRLTRFVEDVGGIQMDSINVLERAHYLTVWSRFGPYDRARLDRLVYERRLLFEYWAHAACLVPRSMLPWWRRAMLDYRVRHTGWSRWLQRNARVLREVEAAVRAKGPMGNADFDAPRSAGRRGGWWNWKPVQHALHYLWMTGALTVHSRRHFHKRFDLMERAFPDGLGDDVVSAEAFLRWHLKRSLHALGAATVWGDPRPGTDYHHDFVEKAGRQLAMMLGPEAVEWYDESLARIAEYFSQESVAKFCSMGNMTVFPNLSLEFLGLVLGGVSLIQWHPRGATMHEGLEWVLVDKNAPDSVKRFGQRLVGLGQSPAGMIMIDDTENFERSRDNLLSALSYTNSMDAIPMSNEAPGNYAYLDEFAKAGVDLKRAFPGAKVLPGAQEEASRAFYGYWQKLMTRSNGK